ncbi:SPOR domain-containing protein [Sphingomonas psychrotolerans]|uniref:SPOR domain-containing protein n=1 Tax=Sphingomonas psychrotolerans TaxID=1327635 RepID=A0ABU3N028_9SPHN|nr:SPOR domain-containing protein [Sphingomonas psychrotolerans]MDT8757904.1 SPOR domain-containing protein [Sphingomonas psychrotolerans]
MKSNAKAAAALLLLAGTGAERAFAHQNAGASYPVPGTAPARSQPAPRLDYAAQDADPTAGIEGPRGSSQRGPGEQRYDEVGYAAVEDPTQGVTGVHASLPVDTLVEVTSLENGRTIVVLVNATDPGAAKPITLSAGAARALGHDGAATIPVRVRKVAAAPGDMAALRSGQPAPARPDTPPILLNALRKHLGAPVAAAPAPAEHPATRPAPPPRAAAPRPAPAARGNFWVQVAALSNARNAQALAQRLSGSVKQGGGLYRVQLGPYATRAQADAARAGAARAGYGDARVLAVN